MTWVLPPLPKGSSAVRCLSGDSLKHDSVLKNRGFIRGLRMPSLLSREDDANNISFGYVVQEYPSHRTVLTLL